MVQRIEYTPYGQERFVLNSALEEGPKYTGQTQDIETDLYYYGSRYYDPVLSRFIQPDSIIPDVYESQSLNPYSYVLNNPLAYVDPSGHENFRVDEEGSEGAGFFDIDSGGLDFGPETDGEFSLGGGGTVSNNKFSEGLGFPDFADRFSLGQDFRRETESERSFGSVLLGVGGSAIAITGVEGGFGFVFNPGIGPAKLDAGFFGAIGTGGGVNVSGDIFIGYIAGGIENVSGITANINLLGGPFSITIFTDPNTGRSVGWTAGIGPGVSPIGASGTYGATGTITVRELLTR